MTLSKLTFAGERSRSAIIRWGAPKICPVLERSCLTDNKNMITLARVLYICDIFTSDLSIIISFHNYLLASLLF